MNGKKKVAEKVHPDHLWVERTVMLDDILYPPVLGGTHSTYKVDNETKRKV